MTTPGKITATDICRQHENNRPVQILITNTRDGGDLTGGAGSDTIWYRTTCATAGIRATVTGVQRLKQGGQIQKYEITTDRGTVAPVVGGQTFYLAPELSPESAAAKAAIEAASAAVEQASAALRDAYQTTGDTTVIERAVAARNAAEAHLREVLAEHFPPTTPTLTPEAEQTIAQLSQLGVAIMREGEDVHADVVTRLAAGVATGHLLVQDIPDRLRQMACPKHIRYLLEATATQLRIPAKAAELETARKKFHAECDRPIGMPRRGGKQHQRRVDAQLRRAAELGRTVKHLEGELAALHTQKDHPAPAPLDLSRLPNAQYIRTRWGWHEVVKVNKVTVKVKADRGMNDLIKNSKILEILEHEAEQPADTESAPLMSYWGDVDGSEPVVL